MMLSDLVVSSGRDEKREGIRETETETEREGVQLTKTLENRVPGH